MVCRLNQMCVRVVANVHFGFPNVVRNGLRISAIEIAQGGDLTRNGGRQKRGPEQRSVPLMQELVHKFSRPCGLVLETI